MTSRGAWSADQFTPPALFRDRVAAAALDRTTTVAAHEVPDVRPEDSDLAAPLIGDDGVTVGVIALRGVAHRSLTASTREDLAAVARWAARSLARAPRDTTPVARNKSSKKRAHARMSRVAA